MDFIRQFVFSRASLVYLKTDLNGRIIDSNAYIREAIGFDPVGRNFADLIVDFNTLTSFSNIVKAGETPLLLNLSLKNGLPQTYYFRFYASGTEVELFGELNTGEVDMLRKSLVETNNELGGLNRELHKGVAELKKLNELKNQFIGMAAHDLRNPIGNIMSYADFLSEDVDCLKEEHVEFLDIIRNSSEFMLKLLNDLLSIVKLDSGKLQLERMNVDIVALIRKNVEINRILASKKHIEIVFNYYEDFPQLNIDPVKIEQVLNNLLTNAVKFSYSRTVVEVNAFMTGDMVTVSVMDQGQGIPEHELEKLFQPFSRLSVKSTGGEESTGLGLAIVQRIITGHRGRIWVESRVGEGTTFYFSLPVKNTGAFQ